MTIQDMINKATHILLVQPDFPHNKRSRNHHEFLPIGLLKIASLLRKQHKQFTLIQYKEDQLETTNHPTPDLVFVTSLFTYWSRQVRNTVQNYKHYYPHATIIVGGIYATLQPTHCKKYTGCDHVHTGILQEAETLPPSYDLVDTDYQIIHTTRGCIRNCDFCGVNTIEPTFTYKKTITPEMQQKILNKEKIIK